MMNMTDTVKQLLIINVIFFVGVLIVGPPAYQYLSMYFPENPMFRAWQPLTNMFMHADFRHILFNMLSLYIFGSVLENLWGAKKFLFFYISCGLGAVALHIAINYISWFHALSALADAGYSYDQVIATLRGPEGYNSDWENVLTPLEMQNFLGGYTSSLLGASGAIYGLMVAFAFLFPNHEMFLLFLPISIKAKYLIGGTVILDMYLGYIGHSIFGVSSGIAHFAHIGGAFIGYIMMHYWSKNSFNNRRWN